MKGWRSSLPSRLFKECRSENSNYKKRSHLRRKISDLRPPVLNRYGLAYLRFAVYSRGIIEGVLGAEV
jgi:hypothetical protein